MLQRKGYNVVTIDCWDKVSDTCYINADQQYAVVCCTNRVWILIDRQSRVLNVFNSFSTAEKFMDSEICMIGQDLLDKINTLVGHIYVDLDEPIEDDQ